MADDNIAVVLPPELSKEVRKIQKELNLDSPGDVIAKGLSLLWLAMGRKVKMESGKEKLEINDFKDHHQTFTLDENGKQEN